MVHKAVKVSVKWESHGPMLLSPSELLRLGKFKDACGKKPVDLVEGLPTRIAKKKITIHIQIYIYKTSERRFIGN